MHVFGKKLYSICILFGQIFFNRMLPTLSIIMLLKHHNRSKHFPFFLISCFHSIDLYCVLLISHSWSNLQDRIVNPTSNPFLQIINLIYAFYFCWFKKKISLNLPYVLSLPNKGGKKQPYLRSRVQEKATGLLDCASPTQ